MMGMCHMFSLGNFLFLRTYKVKRETKRQRERADSVQTLSRAYVLPYRIKKLRQDYSDHLMFNCKPADVKH